jgi:transposase
VTADVESRLAELVVRLRLDGDMEKVAVALALKSAVDAQRYGGGSARAHPSSMPPPESGHVELEALVAEYSRAFSNEGRERVVKKAVGELESWRRNADEQPAGDGVSFDQMLIEDGEGHSAQMVAERYGLSEHHVRRIRKRNKRGVNDGMPDKPPSRCPMPVEERRQEVSRMHTKGMSNRQIGLVLECNEGTVRNDLRAVRTLIRRT